MPLEGRQVGSGGKGAGSGGKVLPGPLRPGAALRPLTRCARKGPPRRVLRSGRCPAATSAAAQPPSLRSVAGPPRRRASGPAQARCAGTLRAQLHAGRYVPVQGVARFVTCRRHVSELGAEAASAVVHHERSDVVDHGGGRRSARSRRRTARSGRVRSLRRTRPMRAARTQRTMSNLPARPQPATFKRHAAERWARRRTQPLRAARTQRTNVKPSAPSQPSHVTLERHDAAAAELVAGQILGAAAPAGVGRPPGTHGWRRSRFRARKNGHAPASGP